MILAIDGTNWLHQLWHAQNGIGVIPMFIRRAEAIIAKAKPSHVVVCMDSRSFRHDLIPTYKAKRAEKAIGLTDLLEAAKTELQVLGPVLAVDGFEADDLLASIAAHGYRTRHKTILASGDKDLRQCLVDGWVTQLKHFRTDRGVAVDCDWYTARRLYGEYNLTPHDWIEYQCLVGDSGDNIPGCPGWGEKTAQVALAIWSTVQGCRDNAAALPVTTAQRKALLEFDEELMRKLVTLRTDVPGISELFALEVVA